MKRQSNFEPNFILTGDWHLRESVPTCRTDDFWEAQWDKVKQVKALQEKYRCPVWHSGDLFDHWKPSPYLLSTTMTHLPEQFYTVYGNHDLPQHNWDMRDRCGIRTLEISGHLKTLSGVHWGQQPKLNNSEFPIFVWHVMTWTGNPPWPGCTDLDGMSILEKYPDYRLILTGHNHKTFTVHHNGRILINPGSLTRQTADQIDHQPAVYLYDSVHNIVRPHYLDVTENVISRIHLDEVKERDDRIDAFVERLSKEWATGFSFEDNLNQFAQANNIRKSVMDIVWRALE